MKDKVIEKAFSARVDLLGGTLDIPPINLILRNVITLNGALSLKSKVVVRESSFQGIEIISHDYNAKKQIPYELLTKENLYHQGTFAEFTFVLQIFDQFLRRSLSPLSSQGICLEFSSHSPPGSGLGGSSTMGVTLYSALSEYFAIPASHEEILSKVKGIEARVLDCGPTGYQDYYPALYGGILGLLPYPEKIEVKQLFTPSLKTYLEENLVLVYSGQTRFSGFNNWEVYKGFFDRQESIREGLQQLADVSHQAYQVIKTTGPKGLAPLIMQEGAIRQKLFHKIATPAMIELLENLQKSAPELRPMGMKVCGAGGGGCFLLVLPEELSREQKTLLTKTIIEKELSRFSMKRLEFSLEAPLF